ncbi:hypothetical protein HMPREF0262_02870 [Clostridium sp. ATCC 29733]|nr:hypothetical protein HMPREF0262_02870 [Clostridium sp. ATCC 29733]
MAFANSILFPPPFFQWKAANRREKFHPAPPPHLSTLPLFPWQAISP